MIIQKTEWKLRELSARNAAVKLVYRGSVSRDSSVKVVRNYAQVLGLRIPWGWRLEWQEVV